MGRRVATAVIFVVVILGGLIGGRLSFVLLFSVITALCLWEYLGMVLEYRQSRDFIRKLLGLSVGLAPFLFTAALQLELAPDRDAFVALWALLFFPLVFTTFIYELYTGSEKPFVNVAFVVLGMVYIGVPFSMLNFIAYDGRHFYLETVFGLLLMNWANDTGAFLVGSRIGKTPLLPRISPKKTWEGMSGGLMITFGFALLLALIFNELRLVDWLVLAAIVVVFGSLGDLVESMLKRSVQVKDSGHLLPGHGGLLDRFDAFIFLLPFATAYLLWIR